MSLPGYLACSLSSAIWWPAAGAPGAGDADSAALVCGVAEAVGEAGFELGDPGDGDLLPAVAVEGLDDLRELVRAEVLQVPGQQALEAVLRVAGPAAPPVLLPDRAPPHVPRRLDGQQANFESPSYRAATPRPAARRGEFTITGPFVPRQVAITFVLST